MYFVVYRPVARRPKCFLPNDHGRIRSSGTVACCDHTRWLVTLQQARHPVKDSIQPTKLTLLHVPETLQNVAIFQFANMVRLCWTITTQFNWHGQFGPTISMGGQFGIGHAKLTGCAVLLRLYWCLVWSYKHIVYCIYFDIQYRIRVGAK